MVNKECAVGWSGCEWGLSDKGNRTDRELNSLFGNILQIRQIACQVFY